jgi:Rrf2 family transcriptional regulator, cysteine metabolism repressor
MKVSTKGRYGLRAMVDLAIYSTEGHVALNAIANRQDISVNYLEQVFSTLRKAGLVKSIKGAQGGYMMAMRPSQMTVGMILRALEGKLVVVDENENTGADKSVQRCIQMMVWDVMTETVNQMVDQMTLEDLANSYKDLACKETSVYYI